MTKSRTQQYYDKNPKARAVKKKQQSKYQSSEKQKKNRAQRNAARRKKLMKGEVSKGDGKDVHHKKGLSGGNGDKNLKVESASKNRGRK